MTPDLRDLAHIPRWAIARVNRRQSVAEHSYFVALYVIDICEKLKEEPSAALLKAALTHDHDELSSGDIPTPYKKKNCLPSNIDLSINERELLILKLADKLEAVLYLADEIISGNNAVEELFQDLEFNLMLHADDLDIKTYIEYMVKRHVNYRGRLE